MTDPISQLLNQGLELHRAGRTAQAEAAYRQVLVKAPGHPAALHLLGLARLAQGDAAQAVHWIALAAEAEPTDAQIAYNLGAARLEAKDPAGALAPLARALELRPDYPEALFNLGEAHRLAGDAEAAVALLLRARTALPGLAAVPNALGLAYRAQGRAREAREAFESARREDPAVLEAEVNLGLLDLDAGDLEGALRRWEALQDHIGENPLIAYNLGVALMQSRNMAQAATLFRRALEADPTLVEARIAEGQALRLNGEAQTALARFQEVLGDHPAHAEAHEGLGLAFLALGNEADAIAAFEAGLALPGLVTEFRARLLSGLGSALRAAHQEAASENRLREALTLDPGRHEASLNLGILLAGQGRIPEACGALLKAAAADPGPAPRLALAMAIHAIIPSLADIPKERAALDRAFDWLEDEGLVSEDPLQDFLLPTFFNAYRGLGNKELHGRLARVLEMAHPALTWMAPHCLEPCDWQGQRRLRIGFISRHFKNHSIGKTSEGLIRHTDPARFERIVFSFEEPHDDIGRGIREAADRFVVLPFNLIDARRLIADQQLDVLFYQDLGMEPTTWLLAFARLAHVQCVTFGHPDTTGIPNLDYWVSSDCFEPEGAADHYSEKLHLLHDVGTLAYYYPPRDPDPRTRAHYGLPETGALYVCPQTLFKFHPDFDAILEGILRGDPDGVLILLRNDIPHWRDQLLARFRRRFPDLLDRVRFLGRLDEDDFNGLLTLADAVLDTPHFNGMNTSLQAFAMGAPVVTLPQAFQRGRHTRGMYARMGWMDLVATSPEDYVALVLRLARDRGFRAAAVGEIEARRGVLFEDMSVVRQFEDFYETAVRASQAPVPQDLKIAVITPYHQEPEAMLRKGHDSVRAQTYPATHIMVSDGPGAAFVEGWPVQHLELPVAAKDNGHTPRTVGALAAIRQGFDAIAYLDADNWLHPRHLEALVRHHLRTGAPVVSSRRTFCRWHDDTPMPFEVDPTHEAVTVDTGCHLFTRPAFRFQPLWSLMPKAFTPVGSRLVYNALRESGLPIAFNGAPTLWFRSQYAQHYVALDEEAPDIAKTGLWDDEAKALHLEQGPEVRAGLAGYFPGAADPRAARWRCALPIFGLGPTEPEIDAVREPEPAPRAWPPQAPRNLLLITDLAVDARKGGSEQRFLAILRLLLEEGHTVHHCSLTPGTVAPPDLAALAEAFPAYRFGSGIFDALGDLPPFDTLWFAHLWNEPSLDAAGLLLQVLRRLAPGPFAVAFDANDYLYKAQAPLLGALGRSALQKRYNALLREADAALFVSGLDRGQALRFAGGEASRAHVVSAAVAPQPAALAVPFADRRDFCFFGGDHVGNVDAVQHFLDDILPRILATRPELELHLYGLGMEPSRLKVPAACSAAVKFHGWVPDLAAALARHRLQVVPVRLGGGIKIKVLDSLAHGTPVLGTRKGCEGLGLEAGISVLLAETPADFAAEALRLHEDPVLWERLQRGGLAHVEARFSREHLRQALRGVFHGLDGAPGR
ncbi:MAG: tetratricopeptide repeat protein [Holophagaceae bacterium]|nr:tetratricopeptide repeat protein [Holophagaceae bacterium]